MNWDRVVDEYWRVLGFGRWDYRDGIVLAEDVWVLEVGGVGKVE